MVSYPFGRLTVRSTGRVKPNLSQRSQGTQGKTMQFLRAPCDLCESPFSFGSRGMHDRSGKVHRRFSCSRSPVRSHRCRRRVAAGGARAEYRNFLGESPRSFCNRGRLGCLNGSIRGDDEASPVAVHILRIDNWDDDHSLYPRRLERLTQDGEGSIPPDDAVDEAFRRRRRGERRERVSSKKISTTHHIPKLQPLVDELRGAGCNSTDEEPGESGITQETQRGAGGGAAPDYSS